MERRRVFALTAVQKAILWVAFLLCVWRFMQVPAVFDAILRFCAAGELPWSDAVMSPDAVLWMVFGVSLTGAVALFLKPFVTRLFAKHQPTRLSSKQLYQALANTAVQPQLVVPALLPSTPWQTRVVRAVRSAVSRLRSVSSWIGRVALQATQQAKAGVRIAADHIWRLTRKAVLWVRVFAIELWAWFRPYAQRFDAWLKRQLNDYQPTAKVIAVIRDILNISKDTNTKVREHKASKK